MSPGKVLADCDWVFGYASLIWRPDFAFEEQRAASLAGFRRVLWQASPDHRGTPERPGRVATLTPDPEARCHGIAFRLLSETREAILDALDEREQGGYDRHIAPIDLDDGRRVLALTYIGWPGNPHYLGPAEPDDMIRQILASRGPSGRNADYVLELARALDALNLSDPGLSALAAHLGGRSS